MSGYQCIHVRTKAHGYTHTCLLFHLDFLQSLLGMYWHMSTHHRHLSVEGWFVHLADRRLSQDPVKSRSREIRV